MAMTLRPSRIRLTQAIYFGHQPGFGVLSVGGGNGILPVPNPIITNGIINLGPLTSDWDAGAFNVNSLNSTLWLNVIAFGADPTGIADSSAAFIAAHAAAPASGAVLYVPRGDYTLVTEVPITKPGIHIVGDGRDATTLHFAPVAQQTMFLFKNGVSTINNCSIRGMTVRSADTTFQKFCVQVDDAVNFTLTEFNLTGGWTGASSVGLLLRGRQSIRCFNFAISEADLPVVIGPNPNLATISFDHSSIEDCELVVTGGLTNAPITVQDGLVMTNAVFRNIAIVKGGPGFSWNNTSMATASSNIIIDNLRSEQGVDSAAYSIDIRSSSGAIQTLSIRNMRMEPGRNGIRLTNTKYPVVESITYEGGGGTTALNLSSTVAGFLIKNSFIQTGAGITDASVAPSAINLTLGGNPAYSSFGTLGSTTIPLTVLGPSMFGGIANNSGAIIDVFKDSTYTAEGTDAIYVRSGAGATNVGIRVGTDKTRNYGFIQTMEPGTSYVTKSLALNQNGGNIGINTAGTAITRPLDLNGPQRFRGVAAPAVSESNSGVIYFDSTTNKFMASLNGGAYVPIIGSGGLTGSGSANALAYWATTTSLTDEPNVVLGGGVYVLDITGDINQATGGRWFLNGSVVFDANTGLAIGGTNGTLVFTDVAIGSGALGNSSGGGGGNNVAVGLQALLHLTSGDSDTAVGELALSATTTGAENVAVGTLAGATNTTGSHNIFIGSGADASTGNLDDAVAIGRGAVIAQSNSLNIGGGITKVGLATSTPKHMLDVNGAVAMRQLEITLLNGLNSDITLITEESWVRIIGPSGAFSVGGFTVGGGPTDGQILAIYNTTAQAMTIVDEDASSTATNRIKTLTGGNVTLRTGTSAATFRYDDTDDRWILMSSN